MAMPIPSVVEIRALIHGFHDVTELFVISWLSELKGAQEHHRQSLHAVLHVPTQGTDRRNCVPTQDVPRVQGQEFSCDDAPYPHLVSA